LSRSRAEVRPLQGENKISFNRVDLEKLAAWLEERAGSHLIADACGESP
jgi:hypothetical protein